MAFDKGHDDRMDELGRSSNVQRFQTRRTADAGDSERNLMEKK